MSTHHPLHPFTHQDELVVTVWAEELDLVADLVGFIEDWLLHAEPETLADLNEFIGPGYRTAARLTEELGTTAVRLRHLSQRGIA